MALHRSAIQPGFAAGAQPGFVPAVQERVGLPLPPQPRAVEGTARACPLARLFGIGYPTYPENWLVLDLIKMLVEYSQNVAYFFHNRVKRKFVKRVVGNKIDLDTAERKPSKFS